MKRRRILPFVLVGFCALCLAALVGCGSSGGDAEEEMAKILIFSDMEVTTDTRTGFFGGRYASFEVTGTVTNNTDKPVNKDNIPALVWDDGSGNKGKLKAEMTQSKLLSGESCDVTYKEELTIDGSSIPELSFSGKVEFSGLDDVEALLNEELQGIASGYADKDAKKAEEEAAKEKEAEQKAQAKEATKSTLQACKGLIAIKAYRAAKDTEYTPKFVDVYGTNVTKDVTESKKGDPIRKAKVTDVDISEGGFFSDATVTFTLDYEDPEAKAEHEAEEERKRKEEEEKALLANATTGEKNALSSAKSYLAFEAFSYQGLVEQLEFEGYTTDEATFAVDNCGADWNEQALEDAKDYLEYSAFSYTGLIHQLEFEKFTTEQATYGADNCGADWNEQAARSAKEYLDYMSFSRSGLIDQLQFEGFTYEQAEYGANAVGL